MLGGLLNLQRSLGQLIDQPLQAAVEGGLKELVPLRLSVVHFRLQAIAPRAQFAFRRATVFPRFIPRGVRQTRRFRRVDLKSRLRYPADSFLRSRGLFLESLQLLVEVDHQIAGSPEVFFHFGLETLQEFALPSRKMLVEFLARVALRLLEFFIPPLEGALIDRLAV